MKTVVKSNDWLSNTFEHGWGNGYVIIPKGHPLYGVDYDDIHELMPSLYVHGGLTYSNYVTSDNPIYSEGDGWIVGFDTNHYGDNPNNWKKEDVIKETENLKKQLMNYKE